MIMRTVKAVPARLAVCIAAEVGSTVGEGTACAAETSAFEALSRKYLELPR
jgi:hypothetical protein